MPPVQINQVEPPVQINQVDHERLMTATQATATEVVVVAYWFELHFLSVTHKIIIVQGRDTLGQNLKQNLKKLDFNAAGLTCGYPVRVRYC